MNDSNANTATTTRRDPDFPDYESFTVAFYKGGLDKLHPELEHVVGKILLANEQVAEELALRRQFELAARLRTCHRVLRAHKFSDMFETTKYCRLPLLCAHCAELQAIKRAQEVMTACQLFSMRVKHSKLRRNEYLIVPDMRVSQLTPSQSFLLAFEVIKEFRALLTLYHARKSGTRHVGQLSMADKKKLLGPTVSAIHLVPAGSGAKYNNAHNQIHLHVTLVTINLASQRYVNNFVASMWELAVRHIVGRSTEKGEVQPRREYRREHEKSQDQLELQLHGYRDKEFSVNRFATPDDVSPLQKCGDDYENDELTVGAKLAGNHLRYLSEFRKKRWGPTTIVDHYFLATSTLKLQPKQLRQFLGHEGVTARQQPCEFDPQRLKHRYLAKLVDVHAIQSWRMLQRVGDC